MASSTTPAVASPSSTLASSTSFETSYTSTESTVTPMAPAPPLTTQYSFPSDCNYNDMYDYTFSTQIEATGYPGDNGWGTLVETFAYINQSAPYYTSCYQPPGRTVGFIYGDGFADWPELGTNVYRNAVCPKSWVAFGVGVTSEELWISGKDQMVTYGTAHCCMSGHTLQADIWNLKYEVGAVTGVDRDGEGSQKNTSPLACAHSFDGRTFSLISTSRHWLSTATGTELSWSDELLTTTHSYKKGRAFYPAWSIEWAHENNTSLQPPWPTLTGGMFLATWTPGAAGPTIVPPPAAMLMGTATAIIATVSVLALLFALGCLFLLWKNRQLKRAGRNAGNGQVAEERSRMMMLGDEVVKPEAAQRSWWQRRRERQTGKRDPKSIELVEREIPMR